MAGNATLSRHKWGFTQTLSSADRSALENLRAEVDAATETKDHQSAARMLGSE